MDGFQNNDGGLPAPLRQPQSKVTIHFHQHDLKPPVFVAGTMSKPHWEPIAMDASDKEGHFVKHLGPLDAGEHHYKFKLGEHWVVDESVRTATDASGNTNNVLVVHLHERDATSMQTLPAKVLDSALVKSQQPSLPTSTETVASAATALPKSTDPVAKTMSVMAKDLQSITNSPSMADRQEPLPLVTTIVDQPAHNDPMLVLPPASPESLEKSSNLSVEVKDGAIGPQVPSNVIHTGEDKHKASHDLARTDTDTPSESQMEDLQREMEPGSDVAQGGNEARPTATDKIDEQVLTSLVNEGRTGGSGSGETSNATLLTMAGQSLVALAELMHVLLLRPLWSLLARLFSRRA